MEIKKYNQGKAINYVSNEFEFSEPFVSAIDEICVNLVLDLDSLIDRYDYHDAPSTVELWLSKDEIKDLNDVTTLLLQKIEELEKEK